ncbi:ribonuclease HII [Virgibacillus sp. C22-A2]|uniref:Ribonuclease HII n=1 Tax=Virgibacillus tibetensis TaxID=3042313 RepID=A0ABU6KCC3_9BACI|nr:ribonuclease HII [Virgibacillus sp. C22-A2]
MNKKSIATLKYLFEAGKLNEELIAELKMDERKGVHQLINSYEKKKEKVEELESKYKYMSSYERHAYASGYKCIAGIDEAGRGPLAGPVVAAAVILPADFKLLGLNDSKQLNEKTRNAFFSIIKEQAVSYGISLVNSQKIDQVNIYEATKIAMYDAVKQLDPQPDYILVDAVPLGNLPCNSEAITKGDAKSITIAAASILAKVTRDNYMKKIHNEYPVYDFKSNMGYGTANHINKLDEHGASPYHRRSFSPVRNIVQ